MTNWKYHYKVLFSFLIFLCFSFTNICFSINIENITPKLNRCVTCHTLTGNSTIPMWPNLAEQHVEYILKQLFEFKKGKDGARYDPNMFGMLQGVTEDELLELSEYYSKQILEKRIVNIDKKKFKLGKEIYLYGNNNTNLVACVGCHGIDGTGNKLANFPSLRWQHKEYLITQMKKFKSGDRTNDINNIMRDIVTNMSDNQIDAVATYISYMD